MADGDYMDGMLDVSIEMFGGQEESYMERLIFTLVLALTAGVIYLLTGRNRRQIEQIPDEMVILCQPPGKRYVVYALGVLVVVFVLFLSVLFIMDGAPKEARPMWGLCVATAVLTLLLMIFCGNVMAKECVYFDGEKLQIEKAFHKPQTFQWKEIRKIEGSFDDVLHLYLLDGTKILTVRIGMVNYEQFCDVLRKKCPGITTQYHRSRTYEQPEKCVLRYGAEYDLMAVMGILLLLMWLVLLLLGDASDVREKLLHSEPSEWFSVWVAPVCGVVSIISLFVFCNTSIRYSGEKVILKYPLRRKREIYWRNIDRVELVPAKKREEDWKKLRIYTPERVYVLNLAVLTRGKDGFLTTFFQMIETYEIPYTETGK